MCQEQYQGKLTSNCLDWFEQAAKQDRADAQLVLARWYSKQPGADADAVKWLELSAKLGNRDAQYLLGERYAQGKGVAKRSDLAQRWNDKAAAQQPEALLKHAKQAASTLALKQYRLAAQQGDRMAQYRMGTLRVKGLGAPRNRIHAYAWFSLAGPEGMTEAVLARDELEATMTKPEVKQAQKLSEHWFGKIPSLIRKS